MADNGDTPTDPPAPEDGDQPEATGDVETTGEGGNRVFARLLEDEMRESFIDYSMSVIVQRALPDVRDGLKPVHRRILYAMRDLALNPGRPYKKSATVVGEVLGKYHPHGDSAVYDAMVRMVQEFSMRAPLVDGQGNFGSVDGDSAAAYRYTEARLAPIAVEMLEDIDKDTVDYSPNFDGRIEEPTVLPSRLPNLLVNGSSGIAVGMATNIPPHNLREVVNALVALIDDPDLSQEELESTVPGPDFPTGGYLCGLDGVREAYRTGRGRIVVRAKAEIIEDDGRPRIEVRELPYMVNKSRLIEQVAELVREKKITEISALRDETDREGIRIVMELKRDAIPEVVLNQLYKHTQLQTTFGAILLALVDGVPQVMPLRTMLGHYIDHRHEVVVRRSEHDLSKAREREHVLEGLKTAVDNIDEVIEIIRGSQDRDSASKQLQERFELSERQADAILDMRLARLTALELDKLEQELEEVRAQIRELEALLADRGLRMQVIKDELQALAAKHGDDRRTEILAEWANLGMEDLIAEEDMVVTLSRYGYVKRMPVTSYRAQRRGGRGLQGMGTKDEDWVEHLFIASTHDVLMIFTRSGRCHWIKTWQIPEAARQSRGKPIVNLLNLPPDEEIASVVRVRDFTEDRHLLFSTRNGMVKKSALAAYKNIRSVGLNAIRIDEDDELIDVQLTEGHNDIILATRKGMAIRFPESDCRPLGRVTRGVRGISLGSDDWVVGMGVIREGTSLLTVTEKGMGKRTAVSEYRLQKRGGKGVINMKLTERTGKVVAIKEVLPSEEAMIITRNGVLIRQSIDGISQIGRATQGVRLVNLDEGDHVVDVARIIPEEENGDAAVEAALQDAGEDPRAVLGPDDE